MKIIYNDWLKEGLDEFLSEQPGVKKANINKNEGLDIVEVSLDDDMNNTIVAKFIDLFQENKWSNMFAFDKDASGEVKTFNYHADDVCCEYCHMHLVRELFDNENIVAVESNFDLNERPVNIDYCIKYKDPLTEKDLLTYIEKNL